jgi:hypothetical protein
VLGSQKNSTIENRNELVAALLLALADALGNPDDVAHLLLLQLDESVEHAQSKLTIVVVVVSVMSL